MDPTAILNIIFKTAVLIKKTVEDVKANQQQCNRLGERIDAINQCLKSLNDRDLNRSEIKRSLDNFRICVQECLDFITQFKEKTSWFVRVFKNQNHKEQFQELNLQLSQCANDLNLGINLKQLFDAKIDEADQKTDLSTIESKIDDIAQLMEQMKEEQYHHYKGIEENIKQRLNSLRYNLQQDIIKIRDPIKAKEIAEEEHAFLHIPFHDLIQEKRIGQGSFADVYRGRWLSKDDTVAIKVIRIQFLDDRMKGDFIHEISTMHNIHYPHILSIFGACMEPNYYALIVEYMSLGSLYDILRLKKLQLTWSDRFSIANQMTKGINYLHTQPKPILHRDIKSLNILMTEHVKGFLVKVADFGLAKIRRETSRQSSAGPSVGTLPWKAPELLKMGKNTEASDVYALGVVFWELCTECEPYEEADDSTISAFVIRGDRLDIPTNIPKRFADLISSAWAHDPQKRPNCQQILNIIKDISNEIDKNTVTKAKVPPVLKKVVAISDETASSQQRSQTPERPQQRQNEIPVPNIPANARWSQKGTTVAGGNGDGDDTNQLSNPFGLFVDDDQTVIIADYYNHRIIQWKQNDTNGQVIAGVKGRGNRLDQLKYPTDVLIDKETDSLMIADRGNERVMRWSRRMGTTQGETLINNIKCCGVALDDQRYLYVSDVEKHEVRRYKLGGNNTNGIVVAGGNGKGELANQLNYPTYLFVDQQQNVYVSDCYNHRVMKWTKGAKEGIVLAGGKGQGSTLTQLNSPYGLFVDTLGTLYIADTVNNRVLGWPQGALQGTVIVGGNGQGTGENQLNNPDGLFFDRHGNLYVVDHWNHRVQRFAIE